MEKVSPKESVEGANTVLRGSVRASKVLQRSIARGTLLRGQSFHSASKMFNSCSDYQNHEVHWRMKPVLTLHSVRSHTVP